VTIEVRRAAASELDEVARVLVAAFAEQRPLALAPTEADMFARYLGDIANVHARRDAEQFVAVEAGRVLGAGTLYGPDHAANYPLAIPPWPRT
jgi:hypothetical protein